MARKQELEELGLTVVVGSDEWQQVTLPGGEPYGRLHPRTGRFELAEKWQKAESKEAAKAAKGV